MSKIAHQFPSNNPTALSIALNDSQSIEIKRVMKFCNSFGDNTQLIIKDSKIDQPLTDTNTFLQADLSPIIGPGQNLYLFLNKKNLNELGKMAGKTWISYDQSNNRYCFRTEFQEGFLPAMELDDNDHIQLCPQFENQDYIGNTVKIENLSDIKAYIGKNSTPMLIVYSKQLEQVYVQKKNSPYTFKSTGAGSLVGKKPDMILICENFLRISQDPTTLSLARNDQGIWLITKMKLHMADQNRTRVFQLLTDVA